MSYPGDQPQEQESQDKGQQEELPDLQAEEGKEVEGFSWEGSLETGKERDIM